MPEGSPELRNTGEFEDSPERRAQFRVAIFGTRSEATSQDKQASKNAWTIAEDSIENGFSVSTGGYDTGVMRAASQGAAEKARHLGIHDPSSRVHGFPLAERISDLPVVPEAQIQRSNTLAERLGHLIDESQAYVVLGGRYGTIVELITALHSENIGHISKEKPVPRPIIIVDQSQEQTDLLSFLANRDEEFKSVQTLDHVYILGQTTEAEQMIQAILETYYRQQNGQEIEPDRQQEMAKYSLRKFLYNQDHFTDSSGI